MNAQRERAAEAHTVAVFRSRQAMDPSLTLDHYRERVSRAQARYEIVEVSSLDDVEAWI